MSIYLESTGLKFSLLDVGLFCLNIYSWGVIFYFEVSSLLCSDSLGFGLGWMFELERNENITMRGKGGLLSRWTSLIGHFLIW